MTSFSNWQTVTYAYAHQERGWLGGRGLECRLAGNSGLWPARDQVVRHENPRIRRRRQRRRWKGTAQGKVGARGPFVIEQEIDIKQIIYLGRWKRPGFCINTWGADAQDTGTLTACLQGIIAVSHLRHYLNSLSEVQGGGKCRAGRGLEGHKLEPSDQPGRHIQHFQVLPPCGGGNLKSCKFQGQSELTYS